MKPFNNVIVSATEPKNKADVWIQHSRNILNQNTFVVGLVNESGGEQSNSDWRKSGYIEVKSGLNICFSQTTKGEGQVGIIQYDSNKSFISTTNKNLTDGTNFLTLKLEDTTKFVRVQHKVINEDENYQLEYGTEPTDYKPCVEDDIKVNDNGVYNSILPEVERFSLEGYQTDLIKTVNRSMLYKEGNKVTIFVYLTMNEITSTSTVNIFKALPERFRPQEELVSFSVGKSDATNSAFTFGALRKDGTIDLAQNPKMASGTNIIFNFSYYV